MEQAKSTYSSLSKVFKKQIKRTEERGKNKLKLQTF